MKTLRPWIQSMAFFAPGLFAGGRWCASTETADATRRDARGVSAANGDGRGARGPNGSSRANARGEAVAIDDEEVAGAQQTEGDNLER